MTKNAKNKPPSENLLGGFVFKYAYFYLAPTFSAAAMIAKRPCSKVKPP